MNLRKFKIFSCFHICAEELQYIQLLHLFEILPDWFKCNILTMIQTVSIDLIDDKHASSKLLLLVLHNYSPLTIFHAVHYFLGRKLRLLALVVHFIKTGQKFSAVKFIFPPIRTHLLWSCPSLKLHLQLFSVSHKDYSFYTRHLRYILSCWHTK